MKKITIILILIFLIFLVIVASYKNNQKQPTNTGLANPASVNCVEQGGEIKIQTRTDGSQYGLCFFGDDMACEEWAMLRGECPVGGVKY